MAKLLGRRAFLGAAGVGVLGTSAGTVASTASAAATAVESGLPQATVGLGKDEAVAVTVMWVPKIRQRTTVRRNVYVCIIDPADGKHLAVEKVAMKPYRATTVQYVKGRSARQSVYGFVTGADRSDIYAEMEVFSISTGQTRLRVSVLEGNAMPV